MVTVQLNIPDHLDTRDTIRFIAAKLYEAGRVTLGQAAEIAGLSKTTFAELLADYDVSIFNYPPPEMVNDAAKI